MSEEETYDTIWVVYWQQDFGLVAIPFYQFSERSENFIPSDTTKRLDVFYFFGNKDDFDKEVPS